MKITIAAIMSAFVKLYSDKKHKPSLIITRDWACYSIEVQTQSGHYSLYCDLDL